MKIGRCMKVHLLPPAVVLLVLLSLNALAAVRYVRVYSAMPKPPYTEFDGAAETIQDAINVSRAGDLILVTNGVYQTGGRAAGGSASNRVALTIAVTVLSINGPEKTIIKGYQAPGTINAHSAVRCAYLTNGATLSGFTLTNGATRAVGADNTDQAGAGVWCESTSSVVSNCVLINNRSHALAGGVYRGMLNNCLIISNSAVEVGGGAFESILNNCVVTRNYAGKSSGGAFSSKLTNCTVVANSAKLSAGGTDASKLFNCIVYYNSAPIQANWSVGMMSYSCTTPTPIGLFNLTNEPLLVDLAAGNLHLRPNSPCINSGNGRPKPGATDADGNSRLAGEVIDIGAYEFQKPGSVISYLWLQQYGLPTDGSADYADPDNDGWNTWKEWRGGSNPTNSVSIPQRTNAPATGSSSE
jgi:hypothetical protein